MLLLLRVPSTGDPIGAIDPPISQGLIAAAVRSHGFKAEVLDLSWTGDTGIEHLLSALRSSDLHVVGMAAYQTNIERCLHIAKLIRNLRPDIRILLGGPQATHMPPEALEAMPEIDGLCRGAAENVMPRYLHGLAKGRLDIQGFIYRTENRIIDGGRPQPIRKQDCSASPFADTLWPLERYPFAVMFSSRGCPNNCSFCYTPAASGRVMTYAPIEKVIQDVILLAQAGVRHVYFADPMFVVDRDRSMELICALRDLQTGITFSCELRAEQADTKLLRALFQARFIKVTYGLESANPGVLARVRKPLDLVRFRETIIQTLDQGIAPAVFYMYGLPGESYDDVLRTFDYVAGLHKVVDDISVPQQMQLYFGTELLDNHQQYGICLMGNRPPYLSPGTEFATDKLGPDQFYALEQEWLRRHHSRPSDAMPAPSCGL